MVTMDWTMGNNSHSLMVASANARVKLADGSWQNYTKVGKDNANVLPKDNNDGLSGTVRSTIIMNAEGTLDFYQGSSNSTIRICYIGITNAENVKDGIQTLSTSLNTTDSAVYDLQGRRLNEKPVRGLYIQNGRKFFVK